MVEAIRAGTAMHFSPKRLGLFSDNPRMDFRAVFG